MKKTHFIYLFILIGLFISYHFVYIYFNQNSTINSDTIWSYSFSRDIIENIDLKQFTFPPFYYFFDIIISFIPSLIGDHVLHSIIVAPINLMILIIFFCYFLKIDQNLDIFKSAILLILSSILTYFTFIFLSFIFSKFYELRIYPLLITKNYFFMQANHGLSSVCALIISYFFYFSKKNLKNKLLLYFLVFIFSLSDFWFAIYFLPIIGIYFLFNVRKKNFIELISLTLIASLTLLITYFFNKELSTYKLTKNNNFDKTVGVISIFIILYISPILCSIYLFIKKKLSNFNKTILLASFVSFIFIFVTDNYSHLNMRFYVFILPLNILLFFEVIKIHLNEINKLFIITLLTIIVGFIQLFTINITNKKMINRHSHFDFNDEISCIKKINQTKEYYVVADYWPGRMIFESLDRKINLITPPWIYNPAWSKLNKNANGLIVVKYDMYPDGNIHEELKNLIESEESNSKEICNNKLIIVENFKLKHQ